MYTNFMQDLVFAVKILHSYVCLGPTYMADTFDAQNIVVHM